MFRGEIKLQVLSAVIWDTFQLSIWKSRHLGHQSVAMGKQKLHLTSRQLFQLQRKTDLETGIGRCMFTGDWRTVLEMIAFFVFDRHFSYSKRLQPLVHIYPKTWIQLYLLTTYIHLNLITENELNHCCLWIGNKCGCMFFINLNLAMASKRISYQITKEVKILLCLS